MPFVFIFVRKGWHSLYICRIFGARTDNAFTKICGCAQTTQTVKEVAKTVSFSDEFFAGCGPGVEKRNPGDHHMASLCSPWGIIPLQGVVKAQWFPTFPMSLTCTVPGVGWARWPNPQDLWQSNMWNSSAARYPSPLAGHQDGEGLITFQRSSNNSNKRSCLSCSLPPRARIFCLGSHPNSLLHASWAATTEAHHCAQKHFYCTAAGSIIRKWCIIHWWVTRVLKVTHEALSPVNKGWCSLWSLRSSTLLQATADHISCHHCVTLPTTLQPQCHVLEGYFCSHFCWCNGEWWIYSRVSEGRIWPSRSQPHTLQQTQNIP